MSWSASCVFLHLFLQREEKVKVKIQTFLYHQKILHPSFVRKQKSHEKILNSL